MIGTIPNPNEKIVFHDVRNSKGEVEFLVSRQLLDPCSGGMIMLRAEGREYSFDRPEEGA